MKIVKNCKICGKEFFPDKYHPHQEVCSDPDCQHKRQILNQKKWRTRNPEYFKYQNLETPWERKRSEYLKKWRTSHKDYFKKYHQSRLSKQKLGFQLDI